LPLGWAPVGWAEFLCAYFAGKYFVEIAEFCKLAPHLAWTHGNVLLFPAVNFAAIPWDFGVILAILGVLIPWRGTVRVRRLMKQEDFGASGRLSLYATTICFQWVIAALVLWRALERGIDLEELGLTISDPWRTAGIAFALTLLLCAGQFAGLRRAARIPAEDRGTLFRITEKIMPRSVPQSIVFAVLASTAGLSEEFLYRGFLLSLFARAFSMATGSVIIAGIMSSLWFAVAHLYQGRRGLITTFIVGMIFASARIWSGSLLPSVVAHASVDLVVGLYVPRLIEKV
jgi:CAAX protease family protein